MGNNTIGLSESKVNTIIDEFNRDSKEVLETLTEEFNKVLKSLAKNWGTEDGKTWVTETLITSLRATGEEVAKALLAFGRVIKTTAESQAEDTNNVFSINAPEQAQLGGLDNQMQNVLDNGFVGVYSTIHAEVEIAHENLNTNVMNKLTKLRMNAINNCKTAFTNEGTSKVASNADTYIEQINQSINKCFKDLNQGIDENTKKAKIYAGTIQEAGLRS